MADKADLAFDRLVLATGSRLRRPPIPGVEIHAFSVDLLKGARVLRSHKFKVA